MSWRNAKGPLKRIRLAVLSNVKGSLVLLFYQSNKLEMFALPPCTTGFPNGKRG